MTTKYLTIPDYRNVYYSSWMEKIPVTTLSDDDKYHTFKVERLNEKAKDSQIYFKILCVATAFFIAGAIAIIATASINIHLLYVSRMLDAYALASGIPIFCTGSAVLWGAMAKMHFSIVKKAKNELTELNQGECDKATLREKDITEFLQGLDHFYKSLGPYGIKAYQEIEKSIARLKDDDSEDEQEINED